MSSNIDDSDSKGDESLESDLLTNAYKFSFEMAAYILEHGKSVSFGKHISIDQAPFRTTSINVFHLRGTEIEKIETLNENDAEVKTVFTERLAIAGLNAPLPTPYGELIFRRSHERDEAMASFINVFNSRLLGISYQTSKRRYISLQDHSGDNCLFVRNLAALCGENLRRMNRRFSRVALLFWTKEKSAAGLESLITALFGFKVRVQQFCTTWADIDEDNRLLYGKKRLGINVGLGTKAAVSNLGVTIELNQEFEKVYKLLDWKKEERSKNQIDPLEQLRCIIRKYIGDFYVYRLSVRPYSVPQMHIGSKKDGSGHRAILGRTAWISTYGILKNSEGNVLSPALVS